MRLIVGTGEEGSDNEEPTEREEGGSVELHFMLLWVSV